MGPVCGLTMPILTVRPAARAPRVKSAGAARAPAAPTPKPLTTLRRDGCCLYSLIAHLPCDRPPSGGPVGKVSSALAVAPARRMSSSIDKEWKRGFHQRGGNAFGL